MTEFDLLISVDIFLNGIVNYCKTIELSFCRTFHVSVFIVQCRCEGCVVEGISGSNGRHGVERVCCIQKARDVKLFLCDWWNFFKDN